MATTPDFLAFADRYLTICIWANKRYTKLGADGKPYIVTYQGGKPSAYTRICDAAFQRYLIKTGVAR